MSLRKPRPPQVCLRCGKSFHTKPAEIAKGGGKFCSPACYWGPRTTVSCGQCGVEFAVKPSAINARYCSRKCTNEAHSSSPESRFWKYVEKTEGCWIWTGHTANSYGRLAVSHGNPIGAHRFSWVIHHGEIAPGMFICHTCDNPACVNPAHLFMGTPAENTADMLRKGRRVAPVVLTRHRGEQHPMAKLDAAAILEIRRLRAGGVQRKDVAARFGITSAHVSAITTKRVWAHI